MEAGVDKVEFQAPGDRILGAGVNESEALFFSNNHGMVCMKTQKSSEPPMDQSISESILEQTSIHEVSVLCLQRMTGSREEYIHYCDFVLR